jgi:tetratricopeptide (TPR) repeat protein
MALPTLGATTTLLPVSVWPMRPRKPLCALAGCGRSPPRPGHLLYNGFRDCGRARSKLLIARRALPNSADVFRYTGMIDRREGHWDEATRNLERALELDPHNFFTLQ